MHKSRMKQPKGSGRGQRDEPDQTAPSFVPRPPSPDLDPGFVSLWTRLKHPTRPPNHERPPSMGSRCVNLPRPTPPSLRLPRPRPELTLQARSTGRLDRLILLLDTGSTPSVRLTAARQLGAIAATRVSHPSTASHGHASVSVEVKLEEGAAAGNKEGIWRGVDGEWDEVAGLVARVRFQLRVPLAQTRRLASVRRVLTERFHRSCPTSNRARWRRGKRRLPHSGSSRAASASGTRHRPLPRSPSPRRRLRCPPPRQTMPSPKPCPSATST